MQYFVLTDFLFVLLSHLSHVTHKYHFTPHNTIIMNNFFVQALTPAPTVTGAALKDQPAIQKAQQTRLTSAITALNKLLTSGFVNSAKRRSHKKSGSHAQDTPRGRSNARPSSVNAAGANATDAEQTPPPRRASNLSNGPSTDRSTRRAAERTPPPRRATNSSNGPSTDRSTRRAAERTPLLGRANNLPLVPLYFILRPNQL